MTSRDLGAQILGIRAPGKVTEVDLDADGETVEVRVRLRYGDQPLRRYVLVARDAAAGSHAIHEGDGLVRPATYLDGDLFSSLSLGGNLVSVRCRLDGDVLRFDPTQTSVAPEAVTGGGGGRRPWGHTPSASSSAADFSADSVRGCKAGFG